jgi:hypothetical protein
MAGPPPVDVPRSLGAPCELSLPETGSGSFKASRRVDPGCGYRDERGALTSTLRGLPHRTRALSYPRCADCHVERGARPIHAARIATSNAGRGVRRADCHIEPGRRPIHAARIATSNAGRGVRRADCHIEPGRRPIHAARIATSDAGRGVRRADCHIEPGRRPIHAARIATSNAGRCSICTARVRIPGPADNPRKGATMR